MPRGAMIPFAPNPDYMALAQASGCKAYQVSSSEELPITLNQAVAYIEAHKKQVVITIKIGMDDGEK